MTVREENGLAALVVMSRFAANPKWLIGLPPTMSPTRDNGLNLASLSTQPKHSATFALKAYRAWFAKKSICGSRAVLIVCRDTDVARQRFGVVEEGIGICYTRTGRRFFDDAKIEKEFLEKVRAALDAADFLELFRKQTGVCLDAKLMPWSAKRNRSCCANSTLRWGQQPRHRLRKPSPRSNALRRTMVMLNLLSSATNNGSML